MSYDDREAASILKKAAEMQAERGGSETDSRLSIDDLKRIAAEAGIAPEMVDAAAQRMAKRSSRRRTMTAERVLTVDRELGTLEYEEVVAILRSEYGIAGTPSTLGSAQEWSGDGDTTKLHLSMVPRDGKTTVTVSVRQEGIVIIWVFAAILNFLGLLMPLAISAKSGQILIGALIALLATLFFLGGASLLGRRIAGQSERQLEDVMNRIAEVCAKAPARRLEQASAAALEEPAHLDQQA